MLVIDVLLIPENVTPHGHDADRLALLANELAYRTSTCEDYQNGYWINFGRDDWKSISSKTYGHIKDAAVQQGLIQTNEKYSSSDENSKGKPFPKSVRLTEQHRNSELKEYRPAKPIRRQSHIRNGILPSDEIGQWLTEKLPGAVLPPDLKLADMLQGCKSTHSRNCLRASAKRLRQRRIHASRCKYGRFHSNFTNMKKELRRQIVWNGQQMIGVDIKNSQPALLPYVLGRHIAKTGAAKLSSVKEEIDVVVRSLGVLPGKFYHRIAISLGVLESVRIDLMKKLTSEQKTGIKKLTYESLYGSLNTTKKSVLFQLLQQVSPLFAAAILDLKKDDHAAFAQILQKTESEIVIDRCCRRLMENFPDMPLITVHDELMTTRQYVKLVRHELQTAFLQKCGYLCSVSMSQPIDSECGFHGGWGYHVGGGFPHSSGVV